MKNIYRLKKVSNFFKNNREKKIYNIINRKETIHPYIICYYNSFKEIIENPQYDNGIITYDDENNIILLGNYCFTGMNGTLSINKTEEILLNKNSDLIIKFLSIFSGRVFFLRSQYLIKLLPNENSYVNTFINNIISKNYNKYKNLPKELIWKKNKSLYNLKKVLEEYTQSSVIIQKYNIYIINDTHENQKQNKYLNKITLFGRKYFISPKILFYTENINIINDIKNIENIISSFLNFFVINIYIPKVKIRLGNYYLSGKIFFF